MVSRRRKSSILISCARHDHARMHGDQHPLYTSTSPAANLLIENAEKKDDFIALPLTGEGIRPTVSITQRVVRFGACPCFERRDVALSTRNNGKLPVRCDYQGPSLKSLIQVCNLRTSTRSSRSGKRHRAHIDGSFGSRTDNRPHSRYMFPHAVSRANRVERDAALYRNPLAGTAPHCAAPLFADSRFQDLPTSRAPRAKG